MTREEKNQIIDELKVTLSNSNVFYLTDTSALDAEATSTLRRECFKKDIQLKVVKNTLLKKALEQIDGKDYSPLYEALKGNTSLMFAETGNVPAKLIKEFRKKHEKPLLKAAYVEEECYVGDDNLNALCDIKSKNDLIADVVLLLESPIKNVISAVQSGQNNIAGLLKTLEERAS
ncbi:MAG: 50S ribosomal protein L10 [Flavobacteriales bacterium]|nr:50S ribosomal protein L10 [Flavobacteriales bacterium]